MQEYQTIQNNYNEKSRGIIKASVILVNPNATEADVEKAIQLGPEQALKIDLFTPELYLLWVRWQVFAMDRRKAAMESYNYIQNRHDEILKIERSLEVLSFCLALKSLLFFLRCFRRFIKCSLIWLCW